MITFSVVQMMFLNYFFLSVTNLQLCARNLGNNSRDTAYRGAWQSRIQHGLLWSVFPLSCLPSQDPPEMEIHSCLGAVWNFHIESYIPFAPLGYCNLCTSRKGSVLFIQSFNALKQGNSNFFLFWTIGVFKENMVLQIPAGLFIIKWTKSHSITNILLFIWIIQ